MRVVGKVLGFVLIVPGYLVWYSVHRYVSTDSIWYRPADLLTWIFYTSAIVLFTANDSQQRGIYERTVSHWPWISATILLGLAVWAVELYLGVLIPS